MANVNFDGTNDLVKILGEQVKIQIQEDEVDLKKMFVDNTKYKLVRSTGIAVAGTAIAGITNFYFYNAADTYPIAILWGTYLLGSIGGVCALFNSVNKINKSLKEQKKELNLAKFKLSREKFNYYNTVLDYVEKQR